MANSRLGLRTRPGLIQSYTETISGDPDANAFIAAAGLTDATQKNAINQLVVDLKVYGIWTKMKAIYPFVGGTADTHKWNLKDARDADSAFRLSFSGGWTHASTGAKPNGTTGYANTFITPSTHSSQNSSHLSFYSRTNSTGDGMNIGQIQTSPVLRGFHMAISFGLISNQMRTRLNSENASTSYTPTDTRGLFSISRINSSEYKGFRNASNVFTFTEASNTPGNIQMIIGAINTTGGVTDYSTHECAFATIGDGLTDTEVSDLYTAVNAFQTTLSRNV